MKNPVPAVQLPPLSLLQNLLGSLNVLICALDAEGRFVYINHASLTILGYPPEELIGRSCFDLMVPQDRASSYQATRDAWEGAEIPTYENQYYHRNGQIITIFWEGGWDKEAQLLYTTGRDVTEQRRLEKKEEEYRQALAATKEQLENLVDRITDGFLGLDAAANVIYWNRAAETISQLPRERMIGYSLWDVLPEPTCSLARRQLALIRQSQKPLHLVYFAERIQRWMEVHAYISQTGVSVFFRDITEQKALEEQLQAEREQRAKEQAQAQRKITAAMVRAAEQERAYVGRELHDNVNQVLTTAKLYTELCADNAAQAAVFLPKCTGLLTHSINEIRRLSRQLAAPAIQTIGLGEALAELVHSIQLTRVWEVALDLSPLACTTVDEELQHATYRVAQEHLTNVLKHARASHLQLTLSCTPDLLTLTITDNGIGFDTAQKAKGLGLASMHNRAAVMNGLLNIRSRPGGGCTLHLQFPVRCSGGTCSPA